MKIDKESKKIDRKNVMKKRWYEFVKPLADKLDDISEKSYRKKCSKVYTDEKLQINLVKAIKLYFAEDKYLMQEGKLYIVDASRSIVNEEGRGACDSVEYILSRSKKLKYLNDYCRYKYYGESGSRDRIINLIENIDDSELSVAKFSADKLLELGMYKSDYIYKTSSVVLEISIVKNRD